MLGDDGPDADVLDSAEAPVPLVCDPDGAPARSAGVTLVKMPAMVASLRLRSPFGAVDFTVHRSRKMINSVKDALPAR